MNVLQWLSLQALMRSRARRPLCGGSALALRLPQVLRALGTRQITCVPFGGFLRAAAHTEGSSARKPLIMTAVVCAGPGKPRGPQSPGPPLGPWAARVVNSDGPTTP